MRFTLTRFFKSVSLLIVFVVADGVSGRWAYGQTEPEQARSAAEPTDPATNSSSDDGARLEEGLPSIQQGVLHFNNGSWSLAVRDLSVIISRDSTNPSAFWYRARAFQQLGLLEKSLADFRRVVELVQNPSSASAFNARGRALFELDRWDEALSDLSNALMLNKKDGDAFLLRGKTLEKMGRPQEAIEDYSQAAKLAPRSSQPFLLRGNARMRNKQFQAGLADQKRAIRNGKIQQGELIYRDPKSGAIFRFVFIPPGTYKIGYSEQQRVKVAASSYQLLFAHNATPMREIVVGKGFFILDREIDEQQYKVFEQSAPDQPRFSDAPIRLGRLPPADNPEPSPTLSDTRPQVNVTWVDAMKFSVAFQQRLGLIVRLPTEIEWECAGRQQRDALYPWKGDVFHGWAEKKGDAATPRKFHSSTNQDVTDSGIYDLAGNVREWCLDEYRNALFEDASFKSKYVPLPYSVPHKAGRRPPRRSSTFDSATWTALGASRRSYRGGGFSDNRYNCQLPVRRNFAANEQSPAIGFRIVVLQRFPK